MRSPSGVGRTRLTVAARRSDRSLMRAPVLLEVADQRRAEVAPRLLAGVDAHVLPEDLERLLPDPQRAPVGDARHRARGRERARARLDRGVHLARLDDLVRQLLGGELAPREDRLARAPVADEARQPQVRGAGDDALVARRERAAAAALADDVVGAQQELAAATDRVRLGGCDQE